MAKEKLSWAPAVLVASMITSAKSRVWGLRAAARRPAAVMTLQKQLGLLNYYEGPVDGLMGPQTAAAITYLQRDAGLPQTGTMNAATQAALQNYLVNGNNQMAG